MIAGAAVAGFVQGLSGFAFGLVAMSFWVWCLPPQLAAAMVVCGTLIGQITNFRVVCQKSEGSLLLPLLLGGGIGVPVGVVILPLLNLELIKSLVGALLLLWCPFMLIAPTFRPITIGGRLADGLVGMLGGILSGLGGFSGPVPTLWCTLRQMDKHAHRQVI